MINVYFNMEIADRWQHIDHDDLFECRQLVGTQIIVGFWATLFGCRVRAGYLADQWYTLDYCMADNIATLHLAYNRIIEGITWRVDRGDDPFNGWPQQIIKPVQKDPTVWPFLLGDNELRFGYFNRNLDFLIKLNRHKQLVQF
jgi:hypothetical protein